MSGGPGGTDEIRILVLSDHWWPSTGGGYRPLRSLLDEFCPRLDAWVCATVADTNRKDAIETPHDWRQQVAYRLMRLHWKDRSRSHLSSVLRHVNPDVVVSASLFSLFTRTAFLLGVPRRTGMLVFPNGELLPGALRRHRLRKEAFLLALRSSRLTASVLWGATTHDEARAMSARLGRRARLVVVACPAVDSTDASTSLSPPGPGPLRIAYVSTISPKKRPSLLLEALCCVRAAVEVTIRGPVADAGELARCRRLAARLPANIRCTIGPAVAPADVPSTLADHHVMALPTRGENYGRIVAEALAVGRFVLLSEHTPWTGRLGRAGAVVPDSATAWAAAIEQLAAYDTAAWEAVAVSARVVSRTEPTAAECAQQLRMALVQAYEMRRAPA